MVTATENLVWYSDAELTKVLPTTTVLTDDVTYYAAEHFRECTSEALAVTVNKVLGTDSFGLASLKLYPNPVNNIMNLTYSDVISSVTVYNLVGQKVLVQSPNAATAQVDLSALTTGCYTVTVTSGSQSKTVKVIKQ